MSKSIATSNVNFEQRTIELLNGAKVEISFTGFEDIDTWSRYNVADAMNMWKTESENITDLINVVLQDVARRKMREMSQDLCNLIGEDAASFIVGLFNTGVVDSILSPYQINEKARNDADSIKAMYRDLNKAIEFGYLEEEIQVWGGNGMHKKFGTRKDWEDVVADAIKEGIAYNPVTGDDIEIPEIEVDDFNPAPTIEQRIRNAMENEMIPVYRCTDKYRDMFKGF